MNQNKGEYKEPHHSNYDKKDKNENYMDWNNLIQSTVVKSVDLVQKTVSAAIAKAPEKKLSINQNPKLCIQRPKNQFVFFLLQIIGFILVLSSLFLFFGAIASNDLLLGILLCLPLGGFGTYLFIHGRSGMELNSRYIKYLREIQNNSAVMIDDLAAIAHQSKDKTIKDIRKLIKNDYFLQARYIDRDQMLILDRDTYQLYKENREKRLASDVLYMDSSNELHHNENKAEYIQILEKGKAILEEINSIEQKVKSEELRLKLDQTKILTQNILRRINEKPTLLNVSRKFVDYYLPTTVKLLNSYIEIQDSSKYSTELDEAKKEINTSFDSINAAYHQILTKLYEDKRVDIMTETSVLDSVLKMDGFQED